jgi:hypothetical protein
MKGVLPLYQLHVVSSDNDIKIVPTKPRKRATQLARAQT